MKPGNRVLSESDISVLRATLLNRISARGKTALYDAVDRALDQFAKAHHTRQVMVVISDGSDNASRSKVEQMLSRIQGSHAVIYTVVMRDSLIPTAIRVCCDGCPETPAGSR